MRVVSNTAPLQYLYGIKHIHLLEKLYGQIVVPQAVVTELLVGRERGHDVPDCRACSWMHIETVPVPSVLKLITNLGAGEAEALALALSKPADLVILDDALARQVAASQEIRHTGTLGILAQAKAHGLIQSVMPLVDEIQRAGIRISDPLRALIRRAVGE